MELTVPEDRLVGSFRVKCFVFFAKRLGDVADCATQDVKGIPW
jgi:hypothetical protein